MDKNEFTPIGNADWWLADGLDPKVSNFPKCDFNSCRDEAYWYFKFVCCDAVYLMCSAHSQQTYLFVQMLPESGKSLVCKGCQTHITGLSFMSTPGRVNLDTAQ